MRRIPLIAAAIALFAAVLSGCGSRDAGSIVKDLDKVASKMESYQASGIMTLHTGQQPLDYNVEVWYQKPNYYRIALTNAKRDITQIVLRNDEGVFVLTPKLGKSYRFQSDWPDNQGQVYLYQTLVQSIVLDDSRKFTTDKDAYVFDVMASNYQNGSFARQKIWLAKKDFAPRHVEVMDTNANLMVEVKFDKFDFGKKFDKSAFDVQKNLGQAPGSASSGTNGGEPSAGNASGGSGSSGGDQDAMAPQGSDDFAVVEPEVPEGVVLKDQSDVQLGERHGVLLRYTGAYDFSLLESASKDEAVSLTQGIVLDLGFTVGLLSGDETKSLTWSYEGVDYQLTTIDLPQEEMVKIAQSIVDASGK
jgi:outer membrane lipoprotein-sorting protein